MQLAVGVTLANLLLVYLSSSSSSSSNGNKERLYLTQGVLDKYRLFKSHMFHIKGDAWAELSQKRQVCLGAQTSLDR